jgi:hypothetical protein
MEDIFDVGDILYQKFLLDIYRHCDKIKLDLSEDEKEKMAYDMVEFVGKVINCLENSEPLLNIRGNNLKSRMKLSKIITENVEKDYFSKSVVSYYISQKKITKKNLDSYLITATMAVLSKGKKTDMKSIEEKISRAKPHVFRVASLLSPAVALHEKLIREGPPQEEVISANIENNSFAKYIG